MTTAIVLIPAVAFVSVAVTEMIAALARRVHRLLTRRQAAAGPLCPCGQCGRPAGQHVPVRLAHLPRQRTPQEN